ncbi:hypothetical protein MKEN_00771500 [Mycena kentingensis (nom. inval.)]|nr:hypothetical protein MKEN_00771500 [Mycena kentingensis (nom. inval.)]
MPPQQGIVHTNGVEGAREYLVLQETRTRVHMVDRECRSGSNECSVFTTFLVAARVSLTQVFWNPLPNATGRATYFFPVPASGAVCAFELRTSDGRLVKAVCKEKSQAREEYEAALEQGNESSSLLEWVNDDIFTISVGSVPANATVSTTLVYTMTLPNDDNADETRFQLPMFVGERYGPPLPALANAAAPSETTRIRITVEIQTSGRIQGITSPSHEFTETAYKTHLGRPSRRRTTVRYRSPTFMDKDFVLVVRADGLDEPRCFAELQRDPSGKHSDTVAMQLSLIPKSKLPPVAGQEHIFLVDRSGSMSGQRMETAKRTLNLILRMLPNNGSTFNIFSFGNSCSSLWTRSRSYDENSLREAAGHIAGMDASYGGTEIKGALEAVFASRITSNPTAVYVLTDGKVTEQDPVIASIQRAVRYSHSKLRVFCLGIGDGVSTAMCEGIARAGGGICLFAGHTESIVGKCAALFRAGTKNFVKNVAVDWNVPDENFSVNFSTPRSSPSKVHLRPAPAVQQSPAQIASLHAGTRVNVYAILTLRRAIVPKEVVISGEFDGGQPFRMVVPVRGTQLADKESRLPLIHALAAWKLIQDHQERTQPLADIVAPVDASAEEVRKASIVRLGERYQVASRHTSFVAIDRGRDDRISRPRRSSTPTRPSTISRRGSSTAAAPYVAPRSLSFFERISSFFSPPDDDLESLDMDVPGGWPPSRVPSRRGSDGYNSAGTFSTLSSFEQDSDWSDWSDDQPPAPPISEVDARMMRSSSPKLEPVRLAPQAMRAARRRELAAAAPPPIVRPPPPPIEPRVIQLVELQLFDGSFDAAIQNVVGEQALKAAPGFHRDDKLWATAVGIAFMAKHLADPVQKELLDDLVEKAYDFLYKNGWDDRTVERVVQAAKRVL